MARLTASLWSRQDYSTKSGVAEVPQLEALQAGAGSQRSQKLPPFFDVPLKTTLLVSYWNEAAYTPTSAFPAVDFEEASQPASID